MVRIQKVVSVVTLFAVALLFNSCRAVPDVKITPTTEVASRIIVTTAELTSQLMYLDMGQFMLTAYCPCYECSEEWGDMTATGVRAKQGRTIAVDEDVIPYGSEVIVNGHTYKAEDCGGKVIGKHVDIYFESHEEADAFGVKYADVLLKVGKSE